MPLNGIIFILKDKFIEGVKEELDFVDAADDIGSRILRVKLVWI